MVRYSARQAATAHACIIENLVNSPGSPSWAERYCVICNQVWVSVENDPDAMLQGPPDKPVKPKDPRWVCKV